MFIMYLCCKPVDATHFWWVSYYQLLVECVFDPVCKILLAEEFYLLHGKMLIIYCEVNKAVLKSNLCILFYFKSHIYLIHEEKNAEIKCTKRLIQGLDSVRWFDVFSFII